MSDSGLAVPDPAPEPEGSAVRGATRTLEVIYRMHSRQVARWAMRLLGPASDFDDVVHEVFLVVRRRLHEFRGDAEITTWLYEITVRVAQSFRRRARWWSWVTGRGRSPSRAPEHQEFAQWNEPTANPHELMEARERTGVVYRVLDQLGEEQRTAFILFELEGLSGNEIAKLTGANLTTVWVRLSRARRKFLAGMKRWEEENP